MAMKRVVAHYMHEQESGIARSRMRDYEDTGAYVVGDVEESEIPALRREGLIVEELAPAPPLDDAGARESIAGAARTTMRARHRRSPAAADAGSIAEAVPSDASYYYVQIRGPLIEPWRDRLGGFGVTLLERFPGDVYKARLTHQQVVALAGAPDIVAAVREMDGSDAGPDVFAPRNTAPSAGIHMLTFDLRLNRPEDAAAVRTWLGDRGVVVAGTSRRKIRVFLPQASPLIDEIPALKEVASFEQYVPPTLSNDRARELMRIDRPNPGPVLGLDGAGQLVGVADTGLDQAHPDFANRIAGLVALGRVNDPSDPDGHGTHVAGSIAGDGAASTGKIRGAAPAAQLFFQSIMDAAGQLGGLPIDLNDLFDEAYQAGARIHNNSWGAATKSMYTINSIEVDEFVDAHRDMLIVIAAGNEGVGAQNVNATQGFVDWLSIGSPASCKNALTVGASRSDRTSGGISTMTWGQAWPADFPHPPIANETVSGNPECLAAFSSRGPCDDRRIKPDLVAPGTDILSTKSSTAPISHFWGAFASNSRYAYMGGTSMATPLVSGCAALVREYFVRVAGHTPSAALLKAALINGTRKLSGADSIAPATGEPNYHQGHGCVDMQRTVPSQAAPNLVLRFVDNWSTPQGQFTATGQRRRFRFTVPAGTPELRVALAYTDRPARALQNNLNLFMQLPNGDKRLGNADLPLSLHIPDPDNNVEVIRVATPAAGDYLIQVTATNLLTGPQDFALVVTGDGIGPMVSV